MLFARSPAECQFYIDLHPCACGDDSFEWSQHHLEERAARIVSVYRGDCPGCGRTREFDFEISGTVVAPPAFGGDEPSRIIDPGEFLTLGRRAAAAAPPDPSDLSAAGVDEAYDAIELAVAALEEVLKFVPLDANGVPQNAFLSDAGRAMYTTEPAQFDRERLEAQLGRYRETWATYERLAFGN
jgi:hypothetical protein